jgi:hypothetical protein
MQKLKEMLEKFPAFNHEEGIVGPHTVDDVTTSRGFAANCDRLIFDNHCSAKKGWRQFDTDQDAWYFGIWVHMEGRVIFTYCEGDMILVECHTKEAFKKELDSLHEFYKVQPPAAVGYDMDGTRTEYYDKRPSADEIV